MPNSVLSKLHAPSVESSPQPHGIDFPLTPFLNQGPETYRRPKGLLKVNYQLAHLTHVVHQRLYLQHPTECFSILPHPSQRKNSDGSMTEDLLQYRCLRDTFYWEFGSRSPSKQSYTLPPHHLSHFPCRISDSYKGHEGFHLKK